MAWIHNYQGGEPDDKTGLVIAIHVVFPVLAFLAVCFRFYTRRYTGHSLWVDDYVALATAMLILVRGGLVIAQTRWGLGLSEEYFPPENAMQFSKIQYFDSPIYTLASLGFKAAILTSYLRIGGFITSYRKIIIGSLVVVTVTQVIFTIVIILTCIPVAKVWNPSIPGHCIKGLPLYYTMAAVSLVFDLIIILIPLPVFWKLSLRKSQKIMLTCLFALGFFITAIQIARITTVGNLKVYVDSQPTIIWSTIEISLGVIICCIPTYSPLLKAFTTKITGYWKHSKSSSSASSPHDAIEFQNKKFNRSRRPVLTTTEYSIANGFDPMDGSTGGVGVGAGVGGYVTTIS